MHLEVLVEEASAEPVIRRLVEDVLPEDSTYAVRVFEGKTDLLDALCERLHGYKNWQFDGLRIMVLVDRDDDDCMVLKQTLERAAADAGLTTKSTANGGPFDVCNRIAIEEIEAWFFGDEPAVQSAFPKVRRFAARAPYRDPDSIAGGTWERLEKLLQQGGYYDGGLRKTDLASKIAPYLNVSVNRSASFNAFVAGLTALVSQ